MSPEVATSMRKRPCPACGAAADERCLNTRGEPTSWIHGGRVFAELFKEKPTS